MKNKLISALFAGLLGFSVVACGTTSETATVDTVATDSSEAVTVSESESTEGSSSVSEDSASNSDATFPLTITHGLGETVIEEKPENVVAIAWGNPDVPLALGIVPVGISEANF